MLWVLAGVALVTLFVFSHVDDWSRDLTENTARTDEASATLKPLRIAKPMSVVHDDLVRMVETMKRWEVAADTPGETESRIHLVRTTPLMRFKDDVWVTLSPDSPTAGEPSAAPESTRVHVRSQSRIGRGDLGQNPRNIRELLDQLRTFVAED